MLGGVRKFRAQRVGVFRAQLENVADLDRVPHGENTAATRAGIAVHGVAEVGKQIDLETGDAGLHSTALVVKDVAVIEVMVKVGETIAVEKDGATIRFVARGVPAAPVPAPASLVVAPSPASRRA